jgi:threonine/homoserine/homoserine lactone efflux protein
MLAYDLAHWSTFLGAAVLLSLSPGPDLAFILGHTARGGTRAGTAAMLGIWAGALCHAVLAAAGLSAVVAASATAFAAVKWVGVAYLLWLGVQALRSGGAAAYAAPAAASAGGFWPVFRQGVLVDLLNPKVAIFFLAFLPQFVVPGAGPVWLQLLAHGVLLLAVGAAIEPPLVLLGGRLTRRLRASGRLALWLDRALGATLIGLGLRLAATER